MLVNLLPSPLFKGLPQGRLPYLQAFPSRRDLHLARHSLVRPELLRPSPILRLSRGIRPMCGRQLVHRQPRHLLLYLQLRLRRHHHLTHNSRSSSSIDLSSNFQGRLVQCVLLLQASKSHHLPPFHRLLPPAEGSPRLLRTFTRGQLFQIICFHNGWALPAQRPGFRCTLFFHRLPLQLCPRRKQQAVGPSGNLRGRLHPPHQGRISAKCRVLLMSH